MIEFKKIEFYGWTLEINRYCQTLIRLISVAEFKKPSSGWTSQNRPPCQVPEGRAPWLRSTTIMTELPKTTSVPNSRMSSFVSNTVSASPWEVSSSLWKYPHHFLRSIHFAFDTVSMIFSVIQFLHLFSESYLHLGTISRVTLS